jgi:hypothetical protein
VFKSLISCNDAQGSRAWRNPLWIVNNQTSFDSDYNYAKEKIHCIRWQSRKTSMINRCGISTSSASIQASHWIWGSLIMNTARSSLDPGIQHESW